MSQQIIYHKKQYKVIKINDTGFIAYNTDRKFKDGHTHVDNFFFAKFIIQYCISNGNISNKQKHLLNNDYIKKSIERVI